MRSGISSALTAAGVLALAVPAFAQDAAPEDEALEAEASAEAQTTVTDDQVDKFALAAIEVNRIQKDPTISADEKAPKIVAAIEEQGLDVQRFNSIARASKADAELKERISAAISAHSRT